MALTVVLMSRNRPDFARQAIRSILGQHCREFRFVVSDNSTNGELRDIVRAEFPTVEYVSRWPGITVSDHFRAVIEMITSAYFVMFHDDDMMEPDYVTEVLQQFHKNPTAAAVATNASRINGQGGLLEPADAFTARGPELIFLGPRELLLRYMSGDSGGAAPFSSYAYNTNAIRGIFMDFSRARNYCDTVFLAKIVQRGPIIWINKRLIKSRIHEGNDSNFCGSRDYKAFVALVEKDYAGVVEQRYIDEYRCLRLFIALESRRRLPWPALKFFAWHFLRLLGSSRSFRRRVSGRFGRVFLRKGIGQGSPAIKIN